MKKEYKLSGMSCGGCVNTVRLTLLKVPNITDVEVQLIPQEAIITMNEPIGTDQLQAQLAEVGQYTIKEKIKTTKMKEKEQKALEAKLHVAINKVLKDNKAVLKNKTEDVVKKSLKQIVKNSKLEKNSISKTETKKSENKSKAGNSVTEKRGTAQLKKK